jgi:exodeoxyribonuclease-3
MRITTWNVNSVRARLDRVIAWLQANQPDLLCMQEIKTLEETFPRDAFEAIGYRLAIHGQKTYNGVAFASRVEPAEITRGMPGDTEDAEARIMAATVDGVRVVNVYVVNGKAVGDPKYDFKLRWLDRFREYLQGELGSHKTLLVCGDFNIAPEDRDVYDPDLWRGKVLFSEPEREKFRALLDIGLADALRLHNSDSGVYTWWDYRMGAFRRGLGLRLDHFLASDAAAKRIRDVAVDREERGGEKPSDHAPVTALLD